jgi:hypothetical protein
MSDLEFLGTDRPRGHCDRCGRFTWSSTEIGEACGIPQPHGFPCSGTIRSSEVRVSGTLPTESFPSDEPKEPLAHGFTEWPMPPGTIRYHKRVDENFALVIEPDDGTHDCPPERACWIYEQETVAHAVGDTGRALMFYHQRLAFANREPLTSDEAVRAWKSEHGIDPDVEWRGY